MIRRRKISDVFLFPLWTIVAKVDEMRDWPWTKRAEAAYVLGLFSFALVSCALIEGWGR